MAGECEWIGLSKAMHNNRIKEELNRNATLQGKLGQ